eukprot:119345_1
MTSSLLLNKYRIVLLIIALALYTLAFLLYYTFNSIGPSVSSIIYTETNTSFIKKPIFCNIVVAHGGDPNAFLATLIWLYPINFLIYAQLNNMILWIDFNNEYLYNKHCYDPKMGHENVWNYYMHPMEPISQGCDMNISNITVLSQEYIFPEMHYYKEWAIHAWYYQWLPEEYIKHKDNESLDYQRYYEEWYYIQRLKGYRIVSKWFKYRQEIIDQVDMIWNSFFSDGQYEILGVQMRGTDKGGPRRRQVEPDEYIEYMSAFKKYYQDKAMFFVATDDGNYLMQVKSKFGNEILYTQDDVIRSNDTTPVFRFNDVSKYDIGRQVIVDILLLSRCDWFIHSSSAVAEAVFYNNIKLHNNSVHLEYIKDRQVPLWYTDVS